MFVTYWAHNFVQNTTYFFNNIINNSNFSSAFHLITSSFATIKVTNSQLNNINTLLTEADYYGGSSTPDSNALIINNSVLATASSTGGSVRIGNSQVDTIQSSNGTIKVMNSYNSNFDPYVNGLY